MVRTPRFDDRKLLASLDQYILDHFLKNPNRYMTLNEIREHLFDNKPLMQHWRIMMTFAVQDGIKGRIKGAIHKWRGLDYPILSSDKIGRGYVYVDPNHRDTPRFWDRKFRANESIREKIPKSERILDEDLFNRCIDGCKEADIHGEMMKVLVKHKLKRKRKKA